jgi:hypothetical protein
VCVVGGLQWRCIVNQPIFGWYIKLQRDRVDTYDHRTLKIELPVRSAVLKQCTGGLVVRWVTTGEYPLLYVFVFFCSCLSRKAVYPQLGGAGGWLFLLVWRGEREGVEVVKGGRGSDPPR